MQGIWQKLHLVIDLFVCWSFTSWQHLRSYQDGYRPYGDFIVLPHWETRLLAPHPNIPFSQIILTLFQPVLALSNNAHRLARKQQVSIFKSLVIFKSLDREPNFRFPAREAHCSTDWATAPGLDYAGITSVKVDC